MHYTKVNKQSRCKVWCFQELKREVATKNFRSESNRTYEKMDNNKIMEMERNIEILVEQYRVVHFIFERLMEFLAKNSRVNGQAITFLLSGKHLSVSFTPFYRFYTIPAPITDN